MTKHLAPIFCMFLLAQTNLSAIAQDYSPAETPVNRVVLFSSGVGYFQHVGTVSGNASARLDFKTDQINDILKSMVLMDLDGGVISAVNYASQEPLERALKSFGVDLSRNPSMGQLLNQLRGSEVELLGPTNVTGKILGVETKTRQIGDPPSVIQDEYLNLLTGRGITSLSLNEIRGIRLVDEKLQAEMNQALSLIAAGRDTDKKPVEIQFLGQGERRVVIGYVVETPVWKTSYRLVLPEDNDKARMQGWAIVENTSDTDWQNVGLSLVSGRPISFVQDLYQPLYIARPVVRPQLYSGLTPQMDLGGMAMEASDKAADSFHARSSVSGAGGRLAGPAPMAAAPPRGESISLEAGALSVAAGQEVGELFQYEIQQAVTLPRRQSAMLPILNDDVTVEKISLYNAATLAGNPLNAVVLNNDTGLNLLAGPVTLYAGDTYAGDARLDDLTPGQERILSYAIDQKVRVNANDRRENNTITSVKILRGVLQVSRKHVYTQTYAIENNADADRMLIIEHEFRPNWNLARPAEFWKKTERHYRFRVPVPAGQTLAFTVVEERVVVESVGVFDSSTTQITWYMQNTSMSERGKAALSRAIELKDELTNTQRRIAELEQSIRAIEQDQNRVRENMKVLDRNSQTYKRYLEKFDSQETIIEQSRKEIGELQMRQAEQRRALEDYLRELTIE